MVHQNYEFLMSDYELNVSHFCGSPLIRKDNHVVSGVINQAIALSRIHPKLMNRQH